MGLFDLFKGKGSKGDKAQPEGDPDRAKAASAAARWAERAGDRRAQNYDRQEAIQALAELGTPEAVAALLKRFTFHIDPSITDQEEKDAAYAGILRAGVGAVEPVRAFSAKAESLAWPMRIVKELLDEDGYVRELARWLERWDIEYSKFIDPKVQLLMSFSEHKHPVIGGAVAKFLQDVNEGARFHAVAATFAQEDPASVDILVRTLFEEESLRVKNKIGDGLIARGWIVPEELRADARKHLPPGYTIDGDGTLKKREGQLSPFSF